MKVEMTVKGEGGEDFRMTFSMCDVDKSNQEVWVGISPIKAQPAGEHWETTFDLDLDAAQTMRDCLDFLIANQLRRANP